MSDYGYDLDERLDDYRDVNLLCWAFYPNQRAFSLFPQLCLRNGEIEKVDNAIFQDDGSFTVMPTGDSGSISISIFAKQYGELVVAKAKRFRSNESYNGSYIKDRLLCLFNPNYSQPDITLERFADAEISQLFYQVIEVETVEPFSKPFTRPVSLADAQTELFCPYVFVEHETKTGTCYYGPFAHCTTEDGRVELTATKFYDFHIFKIASDLLENEFPIFRREEGDYSPICRLIEKGAADALIENASEVDSIDWLPKKELPQIFSRIINDSKEMKEQFERGTLQKLKSAILDYSASQNQSPMFDDARKGRLVEAVSEMESAALDASGLLNSVLNVISDGRLQELLVSEEAYPYIKDRLLRSSGIKERINEETQALKARSTAEEEKLKELQGKISEARQEEQRARKDADALVQERLAAESEKLDKMRQDYEQLCEDTDRKRSEYRQAVVDNDRLKREVDDILSTLNDEATSTGKILESEILRKVVNTVKELDLKKEEAVSPSITWETRCDEDQLSNEEVVDELEKRIVSLAGRNLNRNEVINLAICLMQGFVTTFAGKPGTGKTSLSNILAGALGLRGNVNPAPRFTEIDVENGWTSYKDYIGYHNPITNTYEAANPRVFDAMRQLSRESDSEALPYIFLLDEANLSPIEHYWSPFLRTCDTFTKKGAEVPLGRDENWVLPTSVRFLATVNFDHTTEELSPRFLDRSWVITLESQELAEDSCDINVDTLFANVCPYSYERLMKAFYSKSTRIDDEQVDGLFKMLVNICAKQALPISQRSQLMVRRYVAAASPLMKAQLTDNQFTPLDFAFSQKVLPLISGSREAIEPLVDALLKECRSLTLTTKHLERMREYGESNGYYQYFI